MTHSSLLRHDQTLFRDPEVFEFTYLPEHLHHRDVQVRELAWLLRPALRGGSAHSAVLRGPPGTGKTTTVRRHESHFQFDAERYREWAAELTVWLEDEDAGVGEGDSPPPSDDRLQHGRKCCKRCPAARRGARPQDVWAGAGRTRPVYDLRCKGGLPLPGGTGTDLRGVLCTAYTGREHEGGDTVIRRSLRRFRPARDA